MILVFLTNKMSKKTIQTASTASSSVTDESTMSDSEESYLTMIGAIPFIEGMIRVIMTCAKNPTTISAHLYCKKVFDSFSALVRLTKTLEDDEKKEEDKRMSKKEIDRLVHDGDVLHGLARSYARSVYVMMNVFSPQLVDDHTARAATKEKFNAANKKGVPEITNGDEIYDVCPYDDFLSFCQNSRSINFRITSSVTAGKRTINAVPFTQDSSCINAPVGLFFPLKIDKVGNYHFPPGGIILSPCGIIQAIQTSHSDKDIGLILSQYFLYCFLNYAIKCEKLILLLRSDRTAPDGWSSTISGVGKSLRDIINERIVSLSGYTDVAVALMKGTSDEGLNAVQSSIQNPTELIGNLMSQLGVNGGGGKVADVISSLSNGDFSNITGLLKSLSGGSS